MSGQTPPPAPPAMPEVLPEGTVVGRHRVSARLRDGGMAIVYVGEHVETEARVAIKVLRSEFASRPDCVARFDREAKVMGRLAGCHQVVGVHDVGSLPDGRRYTVMDFIRGTDLDDLLAELSSNDETMPVARVCSLMGDVAAGLEMAHGKKIVHRDLKPANIMVERQRSGEETARIVDFGISADLREAGVAQDLTAVGSVIGTPEYMAPEQAAGVSNVPTVDIYAMGVVCLEMLTLRKPPAQGWKMQAPRASELRAEIPPALQSLLDRMLEHDSTRRIQSATEVRAAFVAIGRALETAPAEAISAAVQPQPQHPAPQDPAPQHPAPQHLASQHLASQHPASQHPASQHPAPQQWAQPPVAQAPSLRPSPLPGGVRAGELSSRSGAAGATVPAPGRSSQPAVLVAPSAGAFEGPPAAVKAKAKVHVQPAAARSSGQPRAVVARAPAPDPAQVASAAAQPALATPPGATRAAMLSAKPPQGTVAAAGRPVPFAAEPPAAAAAQQASPSQGAAPSSRAAELVAAAAREAQGRTPAPAPSADASTSGHPAEPARAEAEEDTPSRVGLWIALAALAFAGLLAAVWFLVWPDA